MENQGGEESQTGSSRNRPEDQSVGGTCGASGAPLRDGTVRPHPVSPRGDGLASLSGHNAHSAVRTRIQDRRERWSKDDNCMVMRAHYIATELARSLNTTYGHLLLDIWREMSPNRPAYAQLLSNRVRWILSKQKLSRAELESIRASCSPSYMEVNVGLQRESPRGSSVAVRGSGLSGREEPITAVEGCFSENLMKYAGIDAEKRPRIPKIQFSRELLELVRSVDSVLPQHLENITSFEQLVDVVYAGAATVCESLGLEIGQQHNPGNTSTPPWKIRLEKKIVSLRKKIGVLHTYLNTPGPSSKVIKMVRKIASYFHVKCKSPTFRDEITVICDNLKQKVKALGNRYRRYNERAKRYHNNRLFHSNQKKFFRNLEVKDVEGDIHLEPGAAHRFWSGVWSEDTEHDEQAYWIREAQSRIPSARMADVEVDEQTIKEVLKKCNNWASPGTDKLHNYWWKHFTSIHNTVASLIRKALLDPSSVPGFFTLGVTYLIPKDGDKNNPKNYRPITCLPAVYKILSAVLTKSITKYLRDNNLMAQEQNGCRMKTKGCKELLVIDQILTKQARRKLRNISVAWVDYTKAFDSVPHSWLLKVLRMHGVAESVIKLLGHLMQTWRTSLVLRGGGCMVESQQIRIKRGIFQGDTLSPVWFCLALNPLSMLLNNTRYGYVISKSRNILISHHLYMDDLKLYAANSDQILRQLEIVAAFSESIKMQMGVEKCAVLNVKRGKIQESEQITLMSCMTIPTLNNNDSYKYLGIKQALDIRTPEMKEQFRQKLLTRISLLLKAKLNSKSLFTAINIWAIPSIAYSFGILTWSATDLREMDRKIRTMLTKFGVHHPHASCVRLYLPRHHGGRGLLNLESLHADNIEMLRKYFFKFNSPLFSAIREADERISPLKLAEPEHQVARKSVDEQLEEWNARALHGRYPSHLESREVNKIESTAYLRAGYLFPETEGRAIAIQDQVMPTRMYLKHIAKQDIPSDRCRRCSQAAESIQHITSSCSILAPREYLERHNAMGKIYHQQMALRIGLLQNEVQQHTYQPQSLLQNARYKLYWDTTLVTDGGVAHNRPDVALFDKVQKTCLLLDFTIPADDNLRKAYTEKITKYADLAFQLRELHGLKSISVLPLIISVNGLVEEHLPENTRRLCLRQNIISSCQKQVILWTARIVRRFLQDP